MWPGMILKSGDRISQPSFPEKEELSSEDSDYEQDYEVLSACSTDPWKDTELECFCATSLDAGGSAPHDKPTTDCEHEAESKSNKEFQPTTSCIDEDENYKAAVPDIVDSEGGGKVDVGK